MEEALRTIIDTIRSHGHALDARSLERILRRCNRGVAAEARITKRALLPFYQRTKELDGPRWRSWEVDPATERALLATLKMKPRRTASGVATITVITKPWPCSSDCRYCPCDIRMPKSYLSDEPACQRAEHNFFDPYLQVKARLHVLDAMGHPTDKIELIVLGGSWGDYPEAYQLWFVRELFRALNDGLPYMGGPELPNAGEGLPKRGPGEFLDGPDAPTLRAERMRDARGDEGVEGATTLGSTARERAHAYLALGISSDPAVLAEECRPLQQTINTGHARYNEAFAQRYGRGAWQRIAVAQQATFAELEHEHRVNESAAHRVVGLCIETRPDLIEPDTLLLARRMGATKIQMGIQSLDQRVLDLNRRHVRVEQIARAFALLRRFGFKTQIHFMANLMGSDPAADRADYQLLVRDERYLPDEVKLYPCSLVESARLMDDYAAGRWQPYAEEELVQLMVDDVLATPAYTRISRMIRDISATDIVAGLKKTNLRQMVEARLAAEHAGAVREIRMREIATDDVRREDLRLEAVPYHTTVSDEVFLQWVTPDGRIAGFLRLSLPTAGPEDAHAPIPANEAMIREVHVYGRVAKLEATEAGAAQHTGLGRALVEEACTRAAAAGYRAINVISSVGTRAYYRKLGFVDAGLYQCRAL